MDPKILRPFSRHLRPHHFLFRLKNRLLLKKTHIYFTSAFGKFHIPRYEYGGENEIKCSSGSWMTYSSIECQWTRVWRFIEKQGKFEHVWRMVRGNLKRKRSLDVVSHRIKTNLMSEQVDGLKINSLSWYIAWGHWRRGENSEKITSSFLYQ